jgi:ectoine hydroxylase-related dioxygenase (phytanoyl-CoA dioxygenase family)
MLLTASAKNDPDWLVEVREALRYAGCAVVTDALDAELVRKTRDAMYRTQQLIHDDVGTDRLRSSGEIGVLRLMPRYDASFLELLSVPEMLAVVDATLSEAAILHLQNGFILPPQDPASVTGFQHAFHQDFPRHLHGYVASVNVMLTFDEFTEANGGTLVVPGTHQRAERPDQRFLERAVQPVTCPAGSMIVFDSTLWHAAGANRSTADRLAINHQFTRSFFKQQMLGWYTRVVTSLDEYYRPAEERLYRSGQG